MQVMQGVAVDEGPVSLAELPLQPGWYAHVQASRGNHRSFRRDGSGRDNRSLTHPDAVENNRPNPDETMAFNHAAVNHGPVSHGNPVTDGYRRPVNRVTIEPS